MIIASFHDLRERYKEKINKYKKQNLTYEYKKCPTKSVFPVFGITLPAVHRSSLSRLEGNFCFLPAVCADSLVHLTRRASVCH